MKNEKPMQKRVFIIHGWDRSPEKDSLPWLRRELEVRGFEVSVPDMPNPDEPVIERWIFHLSSVAKEVDENTYFICHSIGGQAVLRYLEKLPEGTKIGGVVFVAGWFTLTNLETDEEWETAKPWIETPINFDKVKKHANKFIAIFSDNDPFVPLENKEMFEKKIGAKTVVELNKGHFLSEDGVTELPSVIDALLEISK